MSDNNKIIDLDNPEFHAAYKLINETQRSVFLTGKAGTGKSTFLRHICQNTGKKFVVLAPTGISAINARGVTIHSFFQLPLGPLLPNDARIREFRYTKQKKKILDQLELLIIDEISMVRADVIDAIDRALRLFGGNPSKPFGGKQLLLVGDCFQLEPVARREEWDILGKFYKTPFFFSAQAFQKLEIANIELKKVYRQKDEYFIGLLDKVRNGSLTRYDYDELNSRCLPDYSPPPDVYSVLLASTKNIVDNVNTAKLRQLYDDEHVFTGEATGDFDKYSFPTDQDLKLKRGAQVMFIRNDYERRWVNGTIARIEDIDEDEIWVSLDNGEVHKVEKTSWENVTYVYDDEKKEIRSETIGTFIQYPLKLAWAVTIHKSQGLTFDNVVIDTGSGAFAAGQTYVALSRCTSFEGLVLKRPVRQNDIIVRREVVDFARKSASEAALSVICNDAEADALYRQIVEDFNKLDFSSAVDNFIKAVNTRNDMKLPVFKRFLQRLLSRFKASEMKIRKLKEENKMLIRQIDIYEKRLRKLEEGSEKKNGKKKKKKFYD